MEVIGVAEVSGEGVQLGLLGDEAAAIGSGSRGLTQGWPRRGGGLGSVARGKSRDLRRLLEEGGRRRVEQRG